MFQARERDKLMRETVRERSDDRERKTREPMKERSADGARRRLRRSSAAAVDYGQLASLVSLGSDSVSVWVGSSLVKIRVNW
ncbi:hypothetical protein HanPI659440_Chr03g0105861 [Helianthus annuus]|nr:hypothetical protein HanPI659440_Chr03g0105861 [Helianthus annuus]